jgi:glucuronate isomerase
MQFIDANRSNGRTSHPERDTASSLPLSEDFLLTTSFSRRLFHEYARDLPVVDYHNHLDTRVLKENRPFANLARLWVTNDPYKHRAMRIAGVPEAEITGPAEDRVKFDRWAATVPLTLGNPLHPWTRLELARFFDLHDPLNAAKADGIWDAANAQLTKPTHAPRAFLERARVAIACTSDPLLADLADHAALAAGHTGGPRILPSVRPDDLLAFDSPDYPAWLEKLSTTTGISVSDYDSLWAALSARLDAFEAAGCRLADHALDAFIYSETSDEKAAVLFALRLGGKALEPIELIRLRSALLRRLGADYARRNWTLQLHLGAQRLTSSRLRRLAGPAGGYACPGSPGDIASLCGLLDGIETAAGRLPRTILFPLNPADYDALAVMTGSYSADGVAGLVQLGPAWWFNDHDHGIRRHIDALSRHGLLATWVGMTTDSRSLLSMVRHEYFRRVLCEWLGQQAAAGSMPDRAEELAPLILAICHDNAAALFN